MVSGGNAHELTARVNVVCSHGANFTRTTKITLKRLEGNVNGIREVTAVEADWMYLSSPQSGPMWNSRTSKPMPVTCRG